MGKTVHVIGAQPTLRNIEYAGLDAADLGKRLQNGGADAFFSDDDISLMMIAARDIAHLAAMMMSANARKAQREELDRLKEKTA